MTLGDRCYGTSLLAHIGIEIFHADSDDRYPSTTLAEVRRGAVDVVLAPSEPYAFGERHRSQLESVAPVVFIDGKDLFWWGVRTPAALQRLETTVRAAGHPVDADPRHRTAPDSK